MCGILGLYSMGEKLEPSQSLIEKSLLYLSKRGPDASKVFQNESVALGHARLSIQDLSSQGTQPFWDNSKRYCIIYNGEIYNFKSLKPDLKSKGYQFRSKTDTEVLLYLYIEYGVKCLDI